jgi:hypothetical protein
MVLILLLRQQGSDEMRAFRRWDAPASSHLIPLACTSGWVVGPASATLRLRLMYRQYYALIYCASACVCMIDSRSVCHCVRPISYQRCAVCCAGKARPLRSVGSHQPLTRSVEVYVYVYVTMTLHASTIIHLLYGRPHVRAPCASVYTSTCRLDLTEPQPFDFLLNGQLLRQSLRKTITNQRISTENIVTIEYLPAVSLSDESQSVEVVSC